MKKLFLFAAIFTATVMNLQAATVTNIHYIDANGQEQICASATVVASSGSVVLWKKGWYVVNGADVQLSQGADCEGEVHLILADSAKLTSSDCIVVSGSSTYLTIYGQSGQTGKLIVTGEAQNAGIGGCGEFPDGSNITINGGKVIAIGGRDAAGIGGGNGGSAWNIHINGGSVIAIGCDGLSGIGNGANASSAANYIYVNPAQILKADNNNPPTTVIASGRTATTDVAADLADQQYVTISFTFADIYTRPVTLGNYGTICLPKQFTAMEGVEGLYVPAGRDSSKLHCVEVALDSVVAGGAYIYKANAECLTFYLEGESVTQPINNNHMIGWLASDSVLTETLAYYLLSNNALVQLKAGSILRQYRAFINLAQILGTTIPSSLLEGIALGIEEATELDDVNDDVDANDNYKMMVNGQLIIVKDGVKYNAMGQKL